jgi:hypothetical protein
MKIGGYNIITIVITMWGRGFQYLSPHPSKKKKKKLILF